MKACVIGAGLTGLVAASSLAKAGFDVTVLESELHPGGMLSTFRIGWEDLERIPHLIGASDRDLLRLFGELGLQEQIEWFRPTAALYHGGLHQRITRPRDLLRIGTLSAGTRLNAALAALNRGLPPFLCEQSLRCLLPEGRGTGRTVPDEWLAACSRNSGTRSGSSRVFGYPAGGFSTLVRSLIKDIEVHGGRIRYGCTVTDIRRIEGGFRVDCVLEDCTSYFEDVEEVIATVSGRRFAEMTSGAGLPETYLEPLRSARYQGHLSLALRLKQSLTPFHRTLVSSDAPFRLVTEHSALVGLRRYGGHIVYLSRDIDTAEPLWTQSDGEIFRLFFRGLAEIHPGLLRSDVKDWRLTRIRYVSPSRSPSRSHDALHMETAFPGLFLASPARSVAEEHSLDRSVRSGLSVAARTVLSRANRTGATSKAPGIQQSEVF
jgi:protoporphyrinogen oxidase